MLPHLYSIFSSVMNSTMRFVIGMLRMHFRFGSNYKKKLIFFYFVKVLFWKYPPNRKLHAPRYPCCCWLARGHRKRVKLLSDDINPFIAYYFWCGARFCLSQEKDTPRKYDLCLWRYKCLIAKRGKTWTCHLHPLPRALALHVFSTSSHSVLNVTSQWRAKNVFDCTMTNANSVLGSL